MVLGVLLGALGLYEPFIKFAGAGATVPISGFGYLMADGVKKAVALNGLIGAITGGITSASAGITSAMLFGFLLAIFSKPRAKQ